MNRDHTAFGKLGASLTVLGHENLESFRPLLTAQCARAIEEGIPLLALGLLDGEGRSWGAVAGLLRDQRFELLSLLVDPAHRRCGAGTMLLNGLLNLLDLQDIPQVRVEWVALGEEGKSLERFFYQAGFEISEASAPIYCSTLGQLREVPFFNGKKHPAVKPFSALPRPTRVALCRDLPQNELSTVDQEVSCAVLNGSTVNSYILMSREPDGSLMLQYAQAGKNILELPALLRYTAAVASERYPAETTVSMHTINPLSTALAAQLLGADHMLSRKAVLQLSRPADFSWLASL